MKSQLRSMSGRTVVLATLLALAAFGNSAAQPAGQAKPAEQAQPAAETRVAERPDALPSAKSLIAKYVEAVGGEQAIRAVKSMKMTGKLEIPAAGINGTLEIQAMAPNKMALVSDIPGVGRIREGFDGTVAWSLDPNMGPRVKDGEELVQSRFQSEFYGTLHAGDRFRSMQTVEQTEIDGTPVYRVDLVTRDGEELSEYFDVASGLMLATEMEAKTPMGTLKILSKIRDYRKVGALKIPASMSQTMGPMEQHMTFSEIEFDVVDASAFELPAEIRALTEK